MVEKFILLNYQALWKLNQSKLNRFVFKRNIFDQSSNKTRPYDPQYLNDEVRDDDDEESKARLKLKVCSLIDAFFFFK